MMQIINYFACENQAHWRAAIADNEWRAAKYLARKLENGEFHQEVGEGTVYLLTDGEELISFVTLTHQDCINDKSRYPWLGFFYTFPEYRGHRYGGQLLACVAEEAKKRGYMRVYLATDQVGLYEKYGFSFLENRVDLYGDDSRIYVKNLGAL